MSSMAWQAIEMGIDPILDSNHQVREKEFYFSDDKEDKLHFESLDEVKKYTRTNNRVITVVKDSSGHGFIEK